MEMISLKEVERLAIKLASELLSYDEPIPSFSTRFPNILESCLITPFQRFSGEDAYPGLTKKAAMLFYLLIKNHPFQNGNKRIATTTLFVFLYKNGKWLRVNNYALYSFAIWVAGSPAELKNEVVLAVEKFIRSHIIAAE